MAGLLLWEMLTWFILVLAALLAVLTLARATRHTLMPTRDLPQFLQQIVIEHSAPQERTLTRWSRIVKQSNSAFWTHVSSGTEVKR